MKRLAGLFMLTVYMLSFAELHNLARVPVLLAHYTEHRQQEPSISFWSFIELHYFEPLAQDEDYQRDRQLPFRDTDCGHIVSTCICSFAPAIPGIAPPAETNREYSFFNEQSKPQSAGFDIFQPPRSYA